MNAIELADGLSVWLVNCFEGYKLLNKNGILQEIRIFRQYIPQPQGITFTDTAQGMKGYDDSDYEANFPCVIVKCGDIIDNEENRLDMSRVNMRLLFGVYDASPECQGWRDIMGMIDKVRHDLMIDRVISRKYVVQMPITSRMLEADTYPVYFGEMSLVFDIGRPRRPYEFVYRSEVRR